LLSDLRHLADDLGLDFRRALAGAQVDNASFPSQGAFDPCI
jgi:hypothetical protein